MVGDNNRSCDGVRDRRSSGDIHDGPVADDEAEMAAVMEVMGVGVGAGGVERAGADTRRWTSALKIRTISSSRRDKN